MDRPDYHKVQEMKNQNKILIIIAKLMIQQASPTVGTEMLLLELDKIKIKKNL